MDHDGDGRINLEEFVAQSDLERAEAEEKFRELDADMDK
jgi:hypothetical protein